MKFPSQDDKVPGRCCSSSCHRYILHSTGSSINRRRPFNEIPRWEIFQEDDDDDEEDFLESRFLSPPLFSSPRVLRDGNKSLGWQVLGC